MTSQQTTKMNPAFNVKWTFCQSKDIADFVAVVPRHTEKVYHLAKGVVMDFRYKTFKKATLIAGLHFRRWDGNTLVPLEVDQETKKNVMEVLDLIIKDDPIPESRAHEMTKDGVTLFVAREKDEIYTVGGDPSQIPKPFRKGAWKGYVVAVDVPLTALYVGAIKTGEREED